MWYGEYIARAVKQTCVFFNTILFPTSDNVVATPVNNFEIIEKFVSNDYTPYTDINRGDYTAEVVGGIGGLTVAALLIKVNTLLYQRSRRAEKNSHYFFFERLLCSSSRDLILMLLKNGADSAILINYSFFYNPDIPALILWFRRLFCYGKRRKGLKELNQYIYNCTENGNKTRKTAVEEINKTIIECLVNFLNLYGSFKPSENTPSFFNLKQSELELLKNENENKKSSYIFSLIGNKGKTNCYTIGFTETFWKLYLKDNPYKKTEKTAKKTIWQRIEPLLGDLGQVSFIYWIFVFIFYFIPSVAMVAGTTIAVPPLGIALGVLCLKWLYKSYKSLKKNQQQETVDDDETTYKKQAEQVFVKEFQCSVLLENLMLLQPDKRVVFENSKLLKDIKAVNGKSFRSLRFFKGVWEGLISGCFLPFFVAWLFTDLAKWIGGMLIGTALVFGPITLAIIGGGTFCLGLAYGIYRAVHCFREQKNRHRILVEKINVLESKLNGVEIVDFSLSEYDHFIRRLTIDKYFSTRVKKFFNRIWASFKALGTGGLVFRLIILGTLVSFGLSFPPVIIVSCIGVFAVVFALWVWRSYNIKSKLRQVEEVVDHLTEYVHRSNVKASIEKNERLLQSKDREAEEDQNHTGLLVPNIPLGSLRDKKLMDNHQKFNRSSSVYPNLKEYSLSEENLKVRSASPPVQCIEEKVHNGDNKKTLSPQVLARNLGEDSSDSTTNGKQFTPGKLLRDTIEPILRARVYTDPITMKRRKQREKGGIIHPGSSPIKTTKIVATGSTISSSPPSRLFVLKPNQASVLSSLPKRQSSSYSSLPTEMSR